MKLKQGCSIYSDYGLNISADEYSDSGVPIIRTSDVDNSGALDLSNTKFVEPRFVGTKRLQKGDVLFSRSGTIGRAMVFDANVDATYAAYLVRFRPHPKRLLSKFIGYWAQSADYWSQIGADTIQSTIGNFNANKFANLSIPEHDLATQRQIADFLDRETARIDLLIEKKQHLLESVGLRIEAMVHWARDHGDWRRFGVCSRSIQRPIEEGPSTRYSPLGLFNRGRGFFQKTESDFDELGDSSFFFVRTGDLVFSGQFAWEGAVGLVSDAEDGCVVSHRYPVYVGHNGVLSEYLFAYFRSHHGQFLMDNCSRGAAGRNRPLNTRILEKEKIAVPDLRLQKRVAEFVVFERSLKQKIAPSIDRLKEYRSALITASVTGQIDVSEHSKSGATDRRLDALEDQVGA